MTDEMKAKRDEMAETYRHSFFNPISSPMAASVPGVGVTDIAGHFKSGFDACHARMSEEIEKLIDDNMRLTLAKDPEIVDAVKGISIAHMRQVIKRMGDTQALTQSKLAEAEALIEKLEINLAHIEAHDKTSAMLVIDHMREAISRFRGER